MDTSRRTATLVGSLFLVSNATFLFGAFFLVEPILSSPDYLTLVSASRAQVVLGALLEFSNGIAYLGIAILVFPLLNPRFRSLALGYVGFRIIEFVMQTLSDISPLALVSISEEFVRTGGVDAASYQAMGTLLISQRFWAFQMVTISLVLGAWIFYSMLYRSKLIPRFLSIWGLVGATSVFLIFLLDAFGIPQGPVGVLSLLMLSNELFLGVWLIVKGFDSAAVAAAVPGGAPA
jgi:hypothetical protein